MGCNSPTRFVKFILPLSIVLPRKTKKDRVVHLNLNNYRNWPFHLSNAVKIAFCEHMQAQLEHIVVPTPCHLKFTLYRRDARKGDRSNVLSVVEKFFCDAVTHYGGWPDDTDEYILSTTYQTAGIDRVNPRVEVELST